MAWLQKIADALAPERVIYRKMRERIYELERLIVWAADQPGPTSRKGTPLWQEARDIRAKWDSIVHSRKGAA